MVLESCVLSGPGNQHRQFFFPGYIMLPLQETDDTRKVLSTGRPISSDMPSYVKIMPDVLRAALTNLLKDG